MLMRRPSLPDLNIMANISCNGWCSTGGDALIFRISTTRRYSSCTWRTWPNGLWPPGEFLFLEALGWTLYPMSQRFLVHYYANLLLSGKYPYRGLAIHPSSDSSNPDQVELTCLIIRALPFNVYIVASR